MVSTIRTALGSDIPDYPFRVTILMYAEFAVFEAAVVVWEYPKMGTETGAGSGAETDGPLLHDLAGISVTLRTKRIPYGADWWDGMPYVLLHGEEHCVHAVRANWMGDRQAW